MATESRPLPGSYSEMYPGRFLKADMLKGKRVTITITEIIGEDLVGENNKSESEWIVKIAERPLELVLNKTNATCLYRMFGGDPHSWIGKRITIFPTTTTFGRSKVDCIRVYGSPDIPADMEITVSQGRKKAWETVMHRTATKPESSAPAATGTPALPLPARAQQIIKLLGWSPEVIARWEAANAGTDMDALVSKLEAELDK